MNPNIKKILIIVGVLVVSFVIFMLVKGDDEGDALVSTEFNTGGAVNPSSEQASIVGAEIIQALNQINSLNLDRSIFERPVYLSLKDLGQPIPLEPVGRPNPFSPIGRDVSGTNRTTTRDLQVEDTSGDSVQTQTGTSTTQTTN